MEGLCLCISPLFHFEMQSPSLWTTRVLDFSLYNITSICLLLLLAFSEFSVASFEWIRLLLDMSLWICRNLWKSLCRVCGVLSVERAKDPYNNVLISRLIDSSSVEVPLQWGGLPDFLWTQRKGGLFLLQRDKMHGSQACLQKVSSYPLNNPNENAWLVQVIYCSKGGLLRLPK